MTEYKTVLDRIAAPASMPEPAMDRMLLRRERKARRARIGPAVLALAVATAAIGAVLYAFRAGESSRPASQLITPQNAGGLHEVWSTTLGGEATAPVPDGNGVFVGSADGRFSRYGESCTGRTACDPEWTTVVDGAPSAPLLAGEVFVSTDNGTLYAFDGCFDQGRQCGQDWTAQLDGPGTTPAMAIPCGGSPRTSGCTDVFVASSGASQGRGTLYAFQPANCAKRVSLCRPVDEEPIPPGTFAPAYVPNRIYIGQGPGPLYAFRLDCFVAPHCRPDWVGIPGLHARFSSFPVWRPSITDHMFVLTDRGVVAIPSSCSSESCDAAWHSAPEQGFALIAGHDGVFLASRLPDQIERFDPNCAADGSTCQPTWVGTLPSAPAFSSLADYGGVVYVGTVDGQVLAFRGSCTGTCSPLWSARVGSGEVHVMTSPGSYLGSSASVLYVTSGNRLVAFAREQAHPSATASSTARPFVPIGIVVAVMVIGVGVSFIRHRRGRAVAEGSQG